MPTYGESKTKDMVKGLLPSTHRKQARRAKAAASRHARRFTKQRTNLATYDEDVVEDGEWQPPDTNIRRSANVAFRREYDKVSGFIRWAKSTTEGPPDARIAQMRARVPSNVIGQHAIDHLRWLPEFDTERDARQARTAFQNAKWVNRFVATDPWRAAVIAAALRSGLHGLLNNFLNEHHHTAWVSVPGLTPGSTIGSDNVGPRRARVVHGSNDIPAFLADLHAACRWQTTQNKNDGLYHPEWLKALDFFLENCVGCQFEREALEIKLRSYHDYSGFFR